MRRRWLLWWRFAGWPYNYGSAFHYGAHDFSPGVSSESPNGVSRNIHSCSSFFKRESFEVYEPQGFDFCCFEDYGWKTGRWERVESSDWWDKAYSNGFWRSSDWPLSSSVAPSAHSSSHNLCDISQNLYTFLSAPSFFRNSYSVRRTSPNTFHAAGTLLRINNHRLFI